jgi:SH3-like domain-containing protein
MITACNTSSNNSANSNLVNNSINTEKPTIGSTVIISGNTDLKENPSSSSKAIIKLNKGNLVKVIDIKNSWVFVQTVCFVPPAEEGYIPKENISTNFEDITPNQGFIKGTISVFAEPNEKSVISATDVTGAITIFKRENGWAYCRFVGGLEDGWIQQSEIQYIFPK